MRAALVIGGALTAGLLWYRARSALQTVPVDLATVGLNLLPPEIGALFDMGVPRGIRNNNPGNIRYDGTKWQGLKSSDGAFCIFDTPQNGIRAIAKVLTSYQARGVDTVREIIFTWAPPFENNTPAYVSAVASAMGVDADLKLSRASWLPLIKAIIKHENGQQPYTDGEIIQGINAA